MAAIMSGGRDATGHTPELRLLSKDRESRGVARDTPRRVVDGASRRCILAVE
jgi:hypothetical protein